jgi:peptidoglycan-associated lipoprotein
MKRILSLLAVSGLLAACSSTPTATAPQTSATAEPTAAAAPAPAPAPATTTTVVVNDLYPPKGVGGALGQREIFYDFDKFNVKDQFLPVVSAHAKFLKDHAKAHVTLQGNTDERGSSEYNLALGQRRADSVRKLMTAAGVSEGQIETVSFGKEKLRAAGHDEAAWSQNRRTDILYKGE